MSSVITHPLSLLLDPESPYSRNISLLRSAKAHLILNIIIFGSISFTDTQVLASDNLRHLILKDALVNELIKLNRVIFLTRGNASGGISAALTAKGLREYGSNPQIDVAARKIDEAKAKILWSAEEVAARYTNNTRDLFLRNIFRKKQNNDLINDFIAEKLNHSRYLSRSMFYTELIDKIRRYESLYTIGFEKKIKMAADAWYIDGVAEITGSVPLFSKSNMDSLRIRLGANGTYRGKELVFSRDSLSLLDQRYYVEGLSELDAETILNIASGDAARMVRNVIFGDYSNNNIDYKLTAEALAELHRLIIDGILELQPGWRTAKESGNGRRFEVWTLLGSASGSAAVTYGTTLIKDFSVTSGVITALSTGILIELLIRKVRSLLHKEQFESMERESRYLQLESALKRENKDKKTPFNIPMPEENTTKNINRYSI